MPTKAYQKTQEDLDSLRYYPNRFEQDAQAIQAEQIFADAYKAQLVGKKRDYWQAQAKGEARRVWERAQQRVKDAAAEMERATTGRDAGLDWTRVQVKSQEYSARIRNLRPGETLPRVLATLADEAKYTPEGRRAFQLAAADVLNGAQAAELGQARQVVRTWEEEAAQPVKEAQLELAHASAGLDVIREHILETEAELRGKPRHAWEISDWQKDVLNEDATSLGYVVWRDEDTPAAGPQVPPTITAPVPNLE